VTRRGISASAVLLLFTLAASCGKKGPPLAPLRLVPAAVSDVHARRTGQEVELRFTLPTANANGAGTIDLDRVEIYAFTIAPGTVTPPNRDLLTKARVVGTIAVRRPAEEGEDPDKTKTTPADKRPAPGDRVTFVEQLTDDKVKPLPTPALPPPAAATPAAGAAAPGAPAPGTPAPGTPAAGAPAAGAPSPGAQPGAPAAGAPAAEAAPPAGSPYPVRIYAVRGISRGGRPGQASPRMTIPLGAPIAPPFNVLAQVPTERAIVVDWTPPVAEPGGPPLAFNVYGADATNAPMNPEPLKEPKFEIRSVEYGKEQCFVVRTVQTIQNATIESDPSERACVIPVDKFPPAAPKGLRGVAEDGAVNLVWDANAEADLVGYLVLRAEVEGGTLQPLVKQPIKDANYRDASATPGVRYSYVVVAVDTAGNSSPHSTPEAVTAR
jgi:hypothetical protein